MAYEILHECAGLVAGFVAPKEEGLLDSLNQLGLFLPQSPDGSDRFGLF